MGKKHKKHKSERRNEDEGDEKPSLKIVLKLGGEGVYDSDYAASSPASHAGEYTVDEKSHKKKKKKRRHNSDEHQHHTLKIKKFRKEPEEPSNEELPSEPLETVLEPAAALSSPDNASRSSQNTFSPTNVQPKSVERPPRKISIIVTDQMKKALSKLLEHILRQLERKDPHEIFAWPVNDIIAPGYFDVVEKPMDFSTMRKKINQNKYNNVNEFRDDFKLMINNCCTYNRPDTIFHGVGKKLMSAGLKVMSKDRLLNMKRTLGFLHDLNQAECAHLMGLPITQTEVSEVVEIDATEEGAAVEEEVKPVEMSQEASSEEPTSGLRAHSDAISFTDADNEETVAPDVLKVAEEAKERLAKRCPDSKMGFLRIDEVGKTTFNFLNPSLPGQDSQVVDLGTLTGRLTSGLDALPEVKEDKRNKVTPLAYLGFGPFGSFSPTYDSRIANITREESDLLLSAYGGDTEYLFAKSMHNFVKDSDYDLIQMVDDLLDTLSHGAHKQALQSIEEKRKKEENERAKQAVQEIGEFSQQVKMEAEEATTLTEDVSPAELMQEKLDRAGELVVKLEKTQNDRLSENQPSGQSNLRGPSEEEAAIANELQNELSDLIQHAKPEDVSSVRGIRKAVGIDLPDAEDNATTESK